MGASRGVQGVGGGPFSTTFLLSTSFQTPLNHINPPPSPKPPPLLNPLPRLGGGLRGSPPSLASTNFGQHQVQHQLWATSSLARFCFQGLVGGGRGEGFRGPLGGGASGTLPIHFIRHFPMSLDTDASHSGGRELAFMHATQRGKKFEGPIFRRTALSSLLLNFPPFGSYYLGKTVTRMRTQDTQESCPQMLLVARQSSHTSVWWRAPSVGVREHVTDARVVRHRVWKMRRLLPGLVSISDKKVF